MTSTPAGSSTSAFPSDRVSVTGSVKFDGLESDRNNHEDPGSLRRPAGPGDADLVFVAGSTMEGEEAAALAAYRAARQEHPRLRLVLVPRHAERFERVADWLARGASRSSGGAGLNGPDDALAMRTSGRPPVILIDTIGELGAAWGLADVAFVGGSLFPGRGGQNMMEPAAYGACGHVRPPHVELPRDRRAASPPRGGASGRATPGS